MNIMKSFLIHLSQIFNSIFWFGSSSSSQQQQQQIVIQTLALISFAQHFDLPGRDRTRNKQQTKKKCADKGNQKKSLRWFLFSLEMAMAIAFNGKFRFKHKLHTLDRGIAWNIINVSIYIYIATTTLHTLIIFGVLHYDTYRMSISTVH